MVTAKAASPSNDINIQTAISNLTEYKQKLYNTHNHLIKLLQQTIIGSLRTSLFRPILSKRRKDGFGDERSQVFGKFDQIKATVDIIKKSTGDDDIINQDQLELAIAEFVKIQEIAKTIRDNLSDELKFENDIENLLGINGELAKTTANTNTNTHAKAIVTQMTNNPTNPFANYVIPESSIPQKHVNIFMGIVIDLVSEAKELIDKAKQNQNANTATGATSSGATSSVVAISKGGYRKKKSRKKNRRTRLSKKKRNYKKLSNRRTGSRKT